MVENPAAYVRRRLRASIDARVSTEVEVRLGERLVAALAPLATDLRSEIDALATELRATLHLAQDQAGAAGIEFATHLAQLQADTSAELAAQLAAIDASSVGVSASLTARIDALAATLGAVSAQLTDEQRRMLDVLEVLASRLTALELPT